MLPFIEWWLWGLQLPAEVTPLLEVEQSGLRQEPQEPQDRDCVYSGERETMELLLSVSEHSR
jgi:hypothetical protein